MVVIHSPRDVIALSSPLSRLAISEFLQIRDEIG